MTILKLIGWILISIIAIIILLLIFSSVSYSVAKDFYTRGTPERELASEAVFSLFSQDLEGVTDEETIKELDSLQQYDFYFFRHVSENADGLNQNKAVYNHLDHYTNFFTYTEKIPFTPIPKNGRYFRIYSGLLTLAAFKPEKIVNYELPNGIDWPFNLISAKPVMQKMSFNTGDANLVLVNIHNTTDHNNDTPSYGERLKFIKTEIIDKHTPDDHIIINGGWGVGLPGENLRTETDSDPHLDLDWTPEGWKWLYPTDASTETGNGILISENIDIRDCLFNENGIDLRFSLN